MGTLEMWIIGGLVAAVGVLVQWWMKRIEADIASGRKATEAKLEATRREATDQINGIGQRLYAHEIKVAADYVSYPRLTEALRPFTETLSQINAAQERIFARLDGKQDKPGHD